MSKTIAFCWIFSLDPNNGGVERLTLRLIKGFSNRGHNCIFILFDLQKKKFFFEENEIININNFLIDKRVDIFINQNGQSDCLVRILDTEKWRGKYIICHHVEPYYLSKLYNFRHLLAEALSRKNGITIRIAWIIRLLVYPLWKILSNKKIARTQIRNYIHADIYVILSLSFKVELENLLKRKNLSKLVSIPNPLSFDFKYSEVDTWEKKNEVLVVARLSEGQKRISAALKAWKIVEEIDMDGWILRIVGDGPDSDFLKQLASRLKLKRVLFEGKQDPLPYYRTGSLFIMTSKFEGWGLTLTEAMQFGLVPIVFDSYSSLRDIVINGQNGAIVPDGNIPAFANEVISLMRDPQQRKLLSTNAKKYIQKFSLSSVVDQWEAFFK